MSTTAAAREGARQRNGQFGTQRRSEPDPAIAGLETPEAKPPTWGEAVAHAEVLREQGVDVRINEHWMLILIRDGNGELHDSDDGTPAVQGFYHDGTPMQIGHYRNGNYHDPADGTPAWQTFHPDGRPIRIGHYRNGNYHDPADGTPARRGFYPNGTPKWISHYTDDYLQDPADGTPAWQTFYPDGTTEWISHYTDGKLVSKKTFPPPTGEA